MKQRNLTVLAERAKSEIGCCCQTLCNSSAVKEYITELEHLVIKQQDIIRRLKNEKSSE
ncbi:hypothetical protein [Vibrio phage VP41s3]|nr:hypothetical protein [Vibrio phage VP41s3]